MQKMDVTTMVNDLIIFLSKKYKYNIKNIALLLLGVGKQMARQSLTVLFVFMSNEINYMP